MNAEKVNDSLCALFYEIDNAQGLAKSIFELALADDLMHPEDSNSDASTDRKLKVWELLRLHNTSSRLVCVMIDTLASIEKHLIDLEKGVTESLDGIQAEKRTPPETCAEPQKKGKSGGAQK